MLGIDWQQVLDTLIALLPIETVVLVTVIALLRKVNRLWGLFQAIPRLNSSEQLFARNYAERWIRTEMSNWLADHPGETPPWERA